MSPSNRALRLTRVHSEPAVISIDTSLTRAPTHPFGLATKSPFAIVLDNRSHRVARQECREGFGHTRGVHQLKAVSSTRKNECF